MNVQKFIAIIVTGSFLNSFVLAPVVEAVSVPSRAPGPVALSTDNRTVLSIPSNLAQVTASHDFGSDAVVVAIQDLHSHAQVQRTIAATLATLQKQLTAGSTVFPGGRPVAGAGMPAVHVEGGVGDIDTSWVDVIDGTALRIEAAEALLESGRLTGSEYYSIVSGQPLLLKGLEDEVVHRRNVIRYGKILRGRAEIENTIRRLEEDLRFMKGKYCGRSALDLIDAAARRRAGEISADRYYRLLTNTLAASGTRIDEYPDMARYLEAAALGREVNVRRVNGELGAYAAELKRSLPYRDYQAIVETTGGFARLEDLPSQVLPRRGDRRYASLSRFIAYRKVSAAVNPVGLLRDERGAEHAAGTRVARSKSERDIVFLCGFLEVFKDFLHARLSADDYHYLTENYSRFAAVWNRYTYVNRLNETAAAVSILNEYYRDNVARNDIFIGNLFSREQQSGVRVLVAGGFHTRGLQEYFERTKTSYVILTPRVSVDALRAERLYTDIIRAQAERFGREALLYRLLSNLSPSVVRRPDGSVLLRFGTGEQVELSREHGRLRLRGLEAAEARPRAWKRAGAAGMRQAVAAATESMGILRELIGPELVPETFAAFAGMAYFAARKGWLGNDGLTAEMNGLVGALGGRLDEMLGMNPQYAAQLPHGVQNMVADHARRIAAAESSTPAALRAVEGLYRFMISANSAVEYRAASDMRKFRTVHGPAPVRDRAVREAGMNALWLINMMSPAGLRQSFDRWFHNRWNLRNWGTFRQLMAAGSADESSAKRYFATGDGKSAADRVRELQSLTGDESMVPYYRLAGAGDYIHGGPTVLFGALLGLADAVGPSFFRDHWNDIAELGTRAGWRASPEIFNILAEMRVTYGAGFMETRWSSLLQLGPDLAALRRSLGDELLMRHLDSLAEFGASGGSMRDICFGVPAVIRTFGPELAADKFDDLLAMSRPGRYMNMLSDGLPSLAEAFGRDFVIANWEALKPVTADPSETAPVRCRYGIPAVRSAIAVPGDDRETLARLLQVAAVLRSEDDRLPEREIPLYSALAVISDLICVDGDFDETVRRLKLLFADFVRLAQESGESGDEFFRGLPLLKQMFLSGGFEQVRSRLNALGAGLLAIERCLRSHRNLGDNRPRRLYETSLPLLAGAIGAGSVLAHWDEIVAVATTAGNDALTVIERSLPGIVNIYGAQLLEEGGLWPEIVSASRLGGAQTKDVLEDDLRELHQLLGDRVFTDPSFAAGLERMKAAGIEAASAGVGGHGRFYRQINRLAKVFGAEFVTKHWDTIATVCAKEARRDSFFSFDEWLPAFKDAIVTGDAAESDRRLAAIAEVMTAIGNPSYETRRNVASLKEYGRDYARVNWRDIPLLNEIGERGGADLAETVIDRLCGPAGTRTLFRYHRDAVVSQHGYYLPFPVDDSPAAAVAPFLSLGVSQKELTDKNDAKAAALYQEYQSHFLDANFAALELIDSCGHAMTVAQARQVLDYARQMMRIYRKFEQLDRAGIGPALDRVARRLNALWHEMDDTAKISNAMYDLIVPLVSRDMINDNAYSLHSVINRLHAAGSDLLKSLRFHAYEMEVGAGASFTRISYIRDGRLLAGNAVSNRVLRSILKGRFSWRDDTELSEITILGDNFSSTNQLGQHKVEISGNLSDPGDGGFIKIRYYEPADDNPDGSVMRLSLIKGVLSRIGMTVNGEPGASLNAVISKDYGATSTAQLEEVLARIVGLFDSIGNYDMYLPELQRHLRQSGELLDIDELARAGFAEGRVPWIGKEENGFSEYHAYRAAAPERERLRSLLNEYLGRWNMAPLPADMPVGQATINQYFTRPVTAALARGELIAGKRGIPMLNPAYKPLDGLIHGILDDNPETAVQTAQAVNAALGDTVEYSQIGTAGQLIGVAGQIDFGNGQQLVITGLRDRRTRQLLFASAVLSGGAAPATVSGRELVKILNDNGIEARLPERSGRLELRGALDLLRARTGPDDAGMASAQGIAASPGSGSWVAGKVTFSKTPVSGGGHHIVALRFTTPDDIDVIRAADAVITTGGGVLSHAGITTRELGIPSVILPDASWTVDGKSRSLLLTAYSATAFERVEDVNVGRGIIRTVSPVREGDIVMVNGLTGAVRCFAAESQPLLDKAFIRIEKILTGALPPVSMRQWIAGAQSSTQDNRPLADAAELAFTMALENGYQPGQKGRELLEALMVEDRSMPLPESVRERLGTIRERDVTQRIRAVADRLDDVHAEIGRAKSLERLKILVAALRRELDGINELSKLLGMGPAVVGFIDEAMRGLDRRIAQREQEIVDGMAARARALAGTELTESDLPELRRMLYLARRSGLVGPLRNVLLVGAGNYGRSAISEKIIARMCRDAGLNDVNVVSRGMTVEPGRGEIARGAYDALMNSHIDDRAHDVQSLRADDVAAADIVLTMDNKLAAAMGEIYPAARGRIFSLTGYARTGLGNIVGTKKDDGPSYGRMAEIIREAAAGVIDNIRLSAVFGRLQAMANSLESQKRRRINVEGRSMYALGELDDDFVGQAGGKAAKLGEILKVVSRFNAYVPQGVAVGTNAFRRFLDESGIAGEFHALEQQFEERLAAPGLGEQERTLLVAEHSRKIRDLIGSGRLSEETGLGREIMDAIRDRGMGTMAVRSSAVQEDTDASAFAGAAETYLYVTPEAVLDRVKANFQSFYLPRGIQYRIERGESQSGVRPAVLIQSMADAEVAGVLLTVNPVSGRDEVIINANYGLGESVVSNIVPGDQYTASKESGEETRPAIIGSKRIKIVRKSEGSGTETLAVDPFDRRVRCLSRSQVKKLTAVSAALEEHFGYPLDIEFAFEGDRVAILQVRPVTALYGSERERSGDSVARGGVMGWMLSRHMARQEKLWSRSHPNADDETLRSVRRQWGRDYVRNVAPWKENLSAFAAGVMISGLGFGAAYLLSGVFNLPAFVITAYLSSWPLFLAGHAPALQPDRQMPRANAMAAGVVSVAGLLTGLVLAAVPSFSSIPALFAGAAIAETAMVLVHRAVNAAAAKQPGAPEGTETSREISAEQQPDPGALRRNFEEFLRAA